MYCELLIFPASLEGTVIHSPQARSLVGAACENYPVDPGVFCRDAQGKNLQALFAPDSEGRVLSKPPLISFGGGKGFIRLIGLGKAGVELLRSQVALICTAVGAHLQSTYSFRFNDGNCTLEPLNGYARTYFIPVMAVAKKDRDFEKIAARDTRITLEAVIPRVQQLVADGLVAQARFLDESYREAGAPEMARMEASIPTDDALDIQVFEGTPHFKLLKAGGKGKVLCVSGIALTMALDLQGPWSCGVLRSRGWGSILRAA